MPLSFDDPKPQVERRKQQLVFMTPSIKARIDTVRGKLPRSHWIERAILKQLEREELPKC